MSDGKKGVGRPRERNDTSGGDNPIPRSLGDVVRAIRLELRMSQREMLEAIEGVKCAYRLPTPRSKSKQRSPASVSNWETAEDNVSFAVQFRYAHLAGTFSGVLHVISLFYANLRDAAGDGKVTAAKLEDNKALAQGLLELANTALTFSTVEEFNEISARLREADDARTSVITDLLEAYRRGSRREHPGKRKEARQ